jgi:plasmid stabilization system protein ParE
MKLKLLIAAMTDAAGAIAYYTAQEPGLGAEFAAEVRKTIDRILQFPNAWTSVSKRVRRCQVNRFPYGVFYALKNDTAVVIAVLHNHREPRAWQERLEEEDF